MKIVKLLKVRYLVILLLIAAFAIYFSSFKKSPPTIETVLRQQSFGLDFKLILGFFALSVATLTLAKSYEILEKRRKAKLIEEIPSIIADNTDSTEEKDEKLEEALEVLMKENSNLKEKIQSFEDHIRQKSFAEDLYKKSLVALKKEKQRLIDEKEKFLLEINRLQLLSDKVKKKKGSIKAVAAKKKKKRGKTSALAQASRKKTKIKSKNRKKK